MRVIKNKDLDKKKWFNLLEGSQYSSVFQTPEFYNLYNNTDNFSADVFAIEENEEYKSLIVVTIQKEKGVKSFFSRRGIVYGGPLFLEEEALYLEALLNEVKGHFKNQIIYLEVRNHYDYSSVATTFNKSGYEYNEHLNVQLKIKNLNFEDVLSGMKYNRRREIKQSYKEGAITRLATDEKEVRELYDILRDLYLNRVKLPLNPYSFFLNLFKEDIGKVFVVVHNDKVIGGAFSLYYKNMSINTLYYAGLRDYHKKIFSTHLAIIEVIKFAIENKLTMVDFMGAGKPGVDYGVRNYKLQFGGDLVEYGRFDIIFKPLLYKLGIFGLRILSKIK